MAVCVRYDFIHVLAGPLSLYRSQSSLAVLPHRIVYYGNEPIINDQPTDSD